MIVLVDPGGNFRESFSLDIKEVRKAKPRLRAKVGEGYYHGRLAKRK